MNVRPRTVHPFLPPGVPPRLDLLIDLALDLRWTWSHASDALWRAIDPESWERTNNPWLMLQDVSADRLEALSQDEAFVSELHRVDRERKHDLAASTWFAEAHRSAKLSTVGYFSLEFGFGEALPLYAGGLGVLAADHLKAASDLGVPVVGVGLLYQEGYFRQAVDATGTQRESYPYNDPVSLPVQPALDTRGGWAHASIDLPGRKLWLRIWRAIAGNAALYLLDANDPLNTPIDRGITAKLYGGGPEVRLLQELILGVGGWRALDAVGITPDVCHLNEGHAAFVAIERARHLAIQHGLSFDEALWASRAGNVFTTHTPVAAGFDVYAPELVERLHAALGLARLGVGVEALLALGRRGNGDAREPFNMAYLAMRTCARANAVSRLHGEVSRELFKDLYPRWPIAEIGITHVTNGVHVPTWDSIAADRFWTEHCGKRRWHGEMPAIESACKTVPDEELWAVRTEARQQFVHHARTRLQRQLCCRGTDERTAALAAKVLDPNALTLGFARRFAEYKRPNLLLTDPDRFAQLLTRPDRPVQIVVAGKAHPDDAAGKRLVQDWIAFVNRPDVRRRAIFLEDYDHGLAQQLVTGVDLWVNTPRRRWEACGTSGMKVLVNGGLNLSELDGWWAEAFAPDAGWALHGPGSAAPSSDASDAARLYTILEDEVVPTFYTRDAAGVPRGWIARMRASMAHLTPHFSANRMVRQYTDELYLPAATAFARRMADGAKVAQDLVRWHATVTARWTEVWIGDVRVERDGLLSRFTAQIYTGELPPDAIRVEAYAEPAGAAPLRLPLVRTTPLPGAVNAWVWSAQISTERPASDFTIRVVPHHPEAVIPAEEHRIVWQR